MYKYVKVFLYPAIIVCECVCLNALFWLLKETKQKSSLIRNDDKNYDDDDDDVQICVCDFLFFVIALDGLNLQIEINFL